MSTIDFDLVNVPVEYKKINVEDFDSNYYNSTKECISPNPETGYISEELMPILIRDLDVKNTTVINAGTGQGKSKCIIDTVSEYSNKEDYIVVFALPYNNLIEQYFEECKTIIEENKGHCQCFYAPVSAPVAAEPNPAFSPSISPYPSTIWESTFKTQEPSSFLCSLCPGGESLPDPNQLVPSGDGTCGELSTIVSSFTSQSCQEQQAALSAIAIACGCPNA